MRPSPAINGLYFPAQRLLLAVACFIASISFAHAVEPQTIKTEAATYKLWQLGEVGTAFELTDDRNFLVGMQLDPGSATFYVSRLRDLSVVGRIKINSSDGHPSWKVVGSELYVAHRAGWHIYGIPSLVPRPDKERSSRLVEYPTSMERQYGAALAIPGGWLDRGLVLDDTASKVIASLRGCGFEGWVDRSPSWEPNWVSQLRPSMWQIPCDVKATKDTLVLTGFDAIPVEGLQAQDSITGRSGDRWLALVYTTDTGPFRKGTGVFLSVEEVREPREPQPSEFLMVQPSMTLKAAGDGRYHFLGISEPIACSVSTYPAITEDGRLDLGDGGTYPLARLASYPTLPQIEQYLKNDYLPKARAEYERVVGSASEQIPICFEVTARHGDATFTHFLWDEISREELLMTFASRAVKWDVAEREKEAEEARKKEQASRQAQLAAVEENHERMVREDQEAKSLQLNRQIEICGGVVLLTMGVAALGLIMFFVQREQ